MKIYTKNGDQGYTSLLNGSRVQKTDDRIELVGIIDELNSHIGLAKVTADPALKEDLAKVQRTLMKIMSGVVAVPPGSHKLDASEVAALEEKIDVMEAAFERKREFVLYGENEVSARLDVARAVVRRAERQFCRMIKYYTNSDRMALQYLNRLSDYLYVCARYASDRAKSDENEGIRQEVITRILKDMGDN
ncbi:MAG: cob(I)yrinic acid a,c-diamide adenosyltransferase [Lachnospiraceae bacterium]|nr:cob(I)yrinic acid a,c-diamide adenosyltransferase [Lachnospiraceae bacterium]